MIRELFENRVALTVDSEDLRRVCGQSNVFILTHRIDGKTVAMLTLYWVDLLSRRLAVIEEVVTLAGYRNRGFGSGLVREAITRARMLGCDCVELTVREDRPEVQRFYRELGFEDRSNRAYRMYLKQRGA